MAITSGSLWMGNSLQAGLPLFYLASRLPEVIEIADIHNQKWTLRLMRMSAQFVMNMSGASVTNRPSELTGAFMSEKQVTVEILKDKHDMSLGWLYFLKYMMAVYLCDTSAALEAEPLAFPLKKHMKLTALYTRLQFIFHDGILCCFLASVAAKRKRRRRTLLARAKKSLRTIQKFASTCPANYKNKVLLLQAEIETVKGKKASSDILPLYEESVKWAKDEGFMHEESLALEKAGYHVLTTYQHRTDTVSVAQSFFARAVEAYENYGSRLKVQQLEKVLSRLEDIVQHMTKTQHSSPHESIPAMVLDR